MPARSRRIAIVGGGPTAVYTLKHLLQKAGRFEITIFEAGTVAGCGIPYSEEHNSPDMLANITSIEIPPVLISLADWIRTADSALLRRFGIDREAVGNRDFYPRVLIGAYYTDQLRRLIMGGTQAGHTIDIVTGTRVNDIEPLDTGFTLQISSKTGTEQRRFDSVIMATGHLTDLKKPKRDSRLYRSPYPTKDLKLGSDRAALVLGASLSAIDAVVALASRYGAFTGDGPALTYQPRGSRPLRLVMASRKGVIPDADFYYPIPEEPLLIFTPARLEALYDEGSAGFLTKAMKLFKQQLEADDPEFLASLKLARFTPEAFAEAYFDMRKAHQGFEAIAENLSEATGNYQRRRTVMWRYTLMRAHEVFSEIVPFFDAKDLERFQRHLVPVFADAYGCVPHLSVQRVLALHRAGCLDVVALGDEGEIRYGSGLFRLSGLGNEATFETFIDARGQELSSISKLGFTHLDRALEGKDFLRRTHGEREDDQFRLPLSQNHHADIFCLSIPIIMQRYPFAQGLVACADAAKVVAEAF